MDVSEKASTCSTPSHVKRLNNKRMNGSKNRQRHDEPNVSAAATKATNNSHKNNNNNGNNRCNNGNKIIVSCSSSVNSKTTSIFISSSNANANSSKNSSRCNSINDNNNLISSIKCNGSVNKINNVNKSKQNNQDPDVASRMLTGTTKVLTCHSTNTVCTINVSSITTNSSITTTAILTVTCSTISTNATHSKDSSIKINKSYGLHSSHNKGINDFGDTVKNDNNNNIIDNINIDKDVSTSKFLETFDSSVSNICNNAATVGNNTNNNEHGIIHNDLKSITATVRKNFNSNRHLDNNFTRNKDNLNSDNSDLHIPDEFECLNDNIGFSLVKQKKKNNNHYNSGKKIYKHHSSGSDRNSANANFQQLMVPSSRYSLESCNAKKNNNANSSSLKTKGKNIKIGLTDVLLNGFCSDSTLFDDDGCKGDQNINGADQMNCDIINNRVSTSSDNVIDDIINPHTTNKSDANDDEEEEDDDDSDNNFNLVNREMLSGSFESCLSSMSSISSVSNNCNNAGISNNCSDNICHNSFIPCSRAKNNDDTGYSCNDNVVFTQNITGLTTNLTSATNKNFFVTSSSSLDDTKYSRSINCRSSNISCHSSPAVTSLLNNDNNDNIFSEDVSETKGSKLDVLSSFCDNIDITYKTSLHLTTNTIAFTTCCCSIVSTTNSTNSQQKTDFFNTQHKLLYAPLDADFTFGDFAANVLATTSSNYINPSSSSTKIFATTSNQNVLKPSPLSNVRSSFTNSSTYSGNSSLQTFLTTLTSVLSNTCSLATQPIFTAPNIFVNSRFVNTNEDSVTNFSNNSTSSTQTTTFSLTTSTFTSLVTSPTISVNKSLAAHKLPPVEFLYSSYVPCSNLDVTFGSGLEDLVKEMKLIDEINNKMNCISCHSFSENNLKHDSGKVDQTSIPFILPNVVTSKQDLQMSLNKTSCLYKDVNFITKTDCYNLDPSVMKTHLLTTVSLNNVPTAKFSLSNGFVKDIMVSGNKDLSSSVMILTLPQTVITTSSSVTSSTSSSSVTSSLSLAAEKKLLTNVAGDLHKMDELDDCFTSVLSGKIKNVETCICVTDNNAVNINNLNAPVNSSDSNIASNVSNITCSSSNVTSSNKDVASYIMHSSNSKTANGNNFKSSNSFMQLRSEKGFNLTAAQKFLHDSFQKSYNLYIANRTTQHTATTVDDSEPKMYNKK